ncbi:MAG TPA: tetratricopeptide repeat protein [Bacteroidetes bacterium]|nr:tetratricopeptide repeat protein [Bacteroidota bacterium]
MNSRFFILTSLALTLAGIFCGQNKIPDLDSGDAALYQKPDSVVAKTLYQRALYYFRAGDLERAFDRATEGLQYAMRSGHIPAELNILNLLADISVTEGHPGDAIPYSIRVAGILESKNDTAGWRAECLQLAGYYSMEEVYAKEGEYLRKAYELTDVADHEEKSMLMEALGESAMKENMPDSAARCYRSMAEHARRAGMDDTPAVVLQAEAWNAAGEYTEALAANEALLLRFETTGEERQMPPILNNMGFNYTRMGNYRAALDCYLEAIELGKKAGLPAADRALLMTNTATCLHNMDQQKEALEYFSNAIALLEESDMPAEKSRIENMVARIHYHSGDLYNAGAFCRQSIESAVRADDRQKLSEAYLTYSRVLREGNDPIQALEFYEMYLGIRDSIELERRIREQELAGRRYELEKSEKELKLRLKEEEVRELAIRQLTLQLEKEEQEKELLRREKDLEQLERERLQQSFELARQKHAIEQRERENRILEQENRIIELRLREEEQKQREQEQAIALLEQQKKLDQLELERQRTTRKAMILIIVLVVLVALVILGSLISSRHKNALLARQKKEIEEKNTDLEQKNEEISAQRDEIEAQRNMLADQNEKIGEINSEITKSIEYARRIQSSTLPGTEGLTTLFRDHFLLFRPRDIVSGDFYWLATLENSTVLTVVDCTGHGVPGAFMSMLGMSLLKEIVVKEYITQPAVILRRLRKEVITALSQKGTSGEQRDGMDLSLITVHHDTGMMEFAGANNSLYLIRNKDLAPPEVYKGQPMKNDQNGDVLYEIPADKMPIALYDRMDKFTNHEIPLMEGDRVFLFTDGYADQFGGPDGKKFMYKPFKRMLLAHASLPMKEQLEIITRKLDEWMENYEQIDDICVLGVRI